MVSLGTGLSSARKPLTHESDISSPKQIGHGPDEWADARQGKQIGEDEPHPSISPAKISIDVWRYLQVIRCLFLRACRAYVHLRIGKRVSASRSTGKPDRGPFFSWSSSVIFPSVLDITECPLLFDTYRRVLVEHSVSWN